MVDDFTIDLCNCALSKDYFWCIEYVTPKGVTWTWADVLCFFDSLKVRYGKRSSWLIGKLGLPDDYYVFVENKVKGLKTDVYYERWLRRFSGELVLHHIYRRDKDFRAYVIGKYCYKGHVHIKEPFYCYEYARKLLFGRASKDDINRTVMTEYYRVLKRGESPNEKLWKRLGYSWTDFRDSIECKFVGGMSWSNMGDVWHLDHCVPYSWFVFSGMCDTEFRSCYSLDNFQPKFSSDNISKGNSYAEVGRVDAVLSCVLVREGKCVDGVWLKR